MHVSCAVKLRQAATLHASGSCRMISKFSCRTIYMICISMVAYPDYIRRTVRYIERDLYRRVGYGYYWLQELFLQQRSTPRRGQDQRYWNAYSIKFGGVENRDGWIQLWYLLSYQGAWFRCCGGYYIQRHFIFVFSKRNDPQHECHIGGRLVDWHMKRNAN